MWPSISPHGAEVPTSIWNLSYGVWRGLMVAADDYADAIKPKGGAR